MAESSGVEGKRKKAAQEPAPNQKSAPKKRPAKRGNDIGRALRSVYDETLREDVPNDFRDLLGKLS